MTISALILTSHPGELAFWSALAFVAGIALFFYGFVLLKRRRLILDTPFSKIRSAPMGLVELSGLAAGPYTMIAPITARPCYFYRTVVWEFKQSGKERTWVQVASECMFVPFFLDDNSGRVLVDPRGADLDLYHDFEREFSSSFFSTLDAAPANVTAFLARRGVSTHNKLKVQEFCIKPKNALFILGTLDQNSTLSVTPKPIEDVGALRGASARPFPISIDMSFGSSADGDLDQAAFGLYMAKGVPAVPSAHKPMEVIHLSQNTAQVATADMTQQQKIAAALMKAGISNPAAWSAAGVGPPLIEVQTDPAASVGGNGGNGSKGAPDSSGTNGFDLHPPVVLKQGHNDKTFLISWRSQRELARSLFWKSTFIVWGGAALALASLYVFLSIENWL